MGNNEVSLFTYMDALEGAYNEYLRCSESGVEFEEDFSHLVYHTPFPGMAFQAHRSLTNLNGRKPKDYIKNNFEKRVLPGLRFARRVGSTYGASNFVGLAGLLGGSEEVTPGSRIGFFAYGSGAIGEFYSGIVCEDSLNRGVGAKIEESLDGRREVSVSEYENLEHIRDSSIENRNYTPDFSVLGDLYDTHYAGKHRLVLRKVENFYRSYEWS